MAQFYPLEYTKRQNSETGELYGRACICPDAGWFALEGVVTIGGFRAKEITYVAGVLKGEPETVTRDSAMPMVPATVLREWATEQAKLIATSNFRGRELLVASSLVMLFGGDPADLPIAIQDDQYLSARELEEILSDLSEIEVYFGREIDYDEDDNVRPKDFNNDFVVSNNLFLVPKNIPTVLRMKEHSWPDCISNLHVEGRPKNCQHAVEMVIERVWGADFNWDEEKRTVGDVDGDEIVRTVRVYSKPVNTSEYK